MNIFSIFKTKERFAPGSPRQSTQKTGDDWEHVYTERVWRVDANYSDYGKKFEMPVGNFLFSTTIEAHGVVIESMRLEFPKSGQSLILVDPKDRKVDRIILIYPEYPSSLFPVGLDLRRFQSADFLIGMTILGKSPENDHALITLRHDQLMNRIKANY